MKSDLEAERTRRQEAEKESQFKSDLLSMASHDLRTPLTAIRFQLALLRDLRRDDGAFERSLSSLERNVQRLSLLLDDFLDLARVEAGHFMLQREPVNLTKVVDDALAGFGPEAKQRSLVLTRTCDREMWVQGDERRLFQVMNNLVSNAMRYTPEGGRIHVEGRLRERAVEVTVADSGRGMTQEQLARLFAPFRQVHDGPAAAVGSGLGLYISRIVANEHGGALDLDSPGPDQGTRATLRLPAAG